jgi:glyoxylate reductase
MRPRVFVTQPVAASAVERLRKVAEVTVNPDASRALSKDELLAAVRDHDVLFCLLLDRVDRDVVMANGRLRMIATMTITPPDIDTAAATERGIPVTVVPASLLYDATADITWALLLAVARRVVEGDKLVRGGIFPGAQSSYLVGGGVSGKTLGLVGVGGIGRAVARRARGFEMRVLYHDPRSVPDDEARELGLTRVSLDDLLAQSDFVSLHASLTPETRHLIGAREIGLMKPTAYLINAARGPIVVEEALVDALAGRRIAGAGLDVFENEPHVSPKLLGVANAVLTPHVGSAVAEVREAMASVVVDNILAVLEGKRPPNCWNPEIYAGSR